MSEAQQILEKIISDFSIENFTRFFREKSRKYVSLEENYSRYNDDDFKNGLKLGEINFLDDDSLIICGFEVKKELTERAGKKAQYEKAKNILKSDENQKFSAGIFIFNDTQGNFRFSLVYPESIGTRRQWNNFRRFTYFVSSDPQVTNKTFKQRIGDGDFSTLEKIKDAFSVEKVTKEFYENIANWYFWAVKHSKFPKDAEEEENGRNIAVIRLITRMIFIWFMRERGLVPKNLFEEKNIIAILKDLSPKESNYYKAVLQNLFFATLSTKKNDRQFRNEKRFHGHNKDFGNQYVFRYVELFKNPEEIKNYFGDIPFLNGGLFESLDDGRNNYYVDGFTERKEFQPKIPNFLFFSPEIKADFNKDYGTKNKTYKVSGLLEILSSYNFTIDENSPDDAEVALDPELLGRVFENLLASFNPETSTTARKATGSYYTPREIVDYMVAESLKAYFKTQLEGIENIEDKLENLFSAGSHVNPFDKEQTKILVGLIDNVKIVDPAVGSGAFPMGALNKLVFVLNKIDSGNELWKNIQLHAADTIPDSSVRRMAKAKIEEYFQGKNADYGRKLYLIQRCIYGVDIQQIAVEIAKLRFFISLLVDEKIDKDKENWGIEPLPNLDFKIMQGNSLLERFGDIDLCVKQEQKTKLLLEADTFSVDDIEQLKKLVNQYFLPDSQKNKQYLKVTINSIISKFIKDCIQNKLARVNVQIEEIQKTLDLGERDNQQIVAKKRKKEKGFKKLNIKLKLLLAEKEKVTTQREELLNIEKTRVHPYFLWHLWFHDVFQRGGFDVVIGNPPYGVSIKGEYRNAVITSLGKVPDYEICYYFIELGKRCGGKNMHCSYIIPNTILFNVFASNYRKQLLENWNVKEILDCTNFNFFEVATVRNIIFIFNSSGPSITVSYRNNVGANSFSELISTPRKSLTATDLLLFNQNWGLAFTLKKNIAELIIKIKKKSQPLTVYFPEISQGLIAYDKYQGQNEEIIKKRIFHFSKKINKRLKPWLWGEDVTRYNVNWNKREWIDYSKGIANPRRNEFFISKRILVREITNPSIFAAYTEEEYYNDPAIINILEGKEIVLLSLLAILNSKLASFFHFNNSPKATKGFFPKILVEDIKQFPIHNNVLRYQKSLISRVEKILLLKKKKSQDTANFEKQIDVLIYKLYELTYEEVKVVDKDFWLSENEYNNFNTK